MSRILQWDFEQRAIRRAFGLSLSAWPGTCFGLSYDWCKSVLSGVIPQKNPYETNADFVWNITSQHRAYREAPGSSYRYLTQLCRGDQLLLRPQITGAQMDQDLAGIIDDDTRVPDGSAVMIGAPGHVMAFSKQFGTAAFFFDANDGQHKVWGGIGYEIVDLVKAGYPGEWQLWIMTGQPRDRQHYLSR